LCDKKDFTFGELMLWRIAEWR